MMKKNTKLRIGRIAYANLFPIFYTLEREFDCSSYQFIDGVPSAVNRMIGGGDIDISPSSSVEYLRNSGRYLLIENHSISCSGPVRSIFLFSKRPVETLGGQSILVTSQSETSVVLLRIILKKFYGLQCSFISTSEPIGTAMRSNDAYLLIGDDALTEARKWPKLHIYDLGDLWYRNTGLPFTFALWIMRRDCCGDDPGIIGKFKGDLDASKAVALKNLGRIAQASPLRGLLSVEELVEYWQGISYDYSEEHKRGFDLFRAYALQLDLL